MGGEYTCAGDCSLEVRCNGDDKAVVAQSGCEVDPDLHPTDKPDEIASCSYYRDAKLQEDDKIKESVCCVAEGKTDCPGAFNLVVVAAVEKLPQRQPQQTEQGTE